MLPVNLPESFAFHWTQLDMGKDANRADVKGLTFYRTRGMEIQPELGMNIASWRSRHWGQRMGQLPTESLLIHAVSAAHIGQEIHVG